MTDITSIPNLLPLDDIEKINEIISAFEKHCAGKEVQAVVYAGAYFLWAIIHEHVDHQHRAMALAQVANILFPDEEGVGTS